MQVLLVAGLIETQLFKEPGQRLVVHSVSKEIGFSEIVCHEIIDALCDMSFLLFLLHFFSHSIQDQSLGGFAYGKYGRLAEGDNPTAPWVLFVVISLVDILTANQSVILYSLSPIHVDCCHFSFASYI